jgi:hypothetical protein
MPSTDSTTLRRALETTSWLQAIYTSEVFFLTGAPFMMLPVSPLKEATLMSRPLSKRVQMASAAMSSQESRSNHLYNSHADNHIYYNFYWTQAAIFVVRAGLNAAAFGLILKPVPEIQSNEERAYELVYKTITTGTETHIGWWLILGSLILHFLAYASHRLYLIRSFLQDPTASDGPAVLPHKMYTVAHISILNFLLDLPGYHTLSTRFLRYVIVALNLTATLILVFYLFVLENFVLAWGCYPRGTSLGDFRFGVCPGYWRDPDHYYAPVCDSPGARCGEEEIRDNQMFSHELGITSGLVAFSFSLYIISIPQKVTYYRFIKEKAAQYVSTRPTGTKQHLS